METPSSIQKSTKRMEKTTMINKIKIKLIAMYMLFFGMTAMLYIPLPVIGVIVASCVLYSGDWMLALIISCFAFLSYMTSEWYMELFMQQHYAMKEKISKLRN